MNDHQSLITVAICTYNRHELLKKLLQNLCSDQLLPQELYKVIVVDNSDDSRSRQLFADEFRVRTNLSILESCPAGLSRARNVALESCTTGYIVYLDDDAWPKPEWLSSILRAFTVHDPSIVAGPIYPAWPGAQPEWLPHKYVGCLTILDYGANDRWLSESEFAYGANMAFKVRALREVGGFNVGLGRKGNHSLLSEEELEVQLKLGQAGHHAFYAAAAGVVHTVHSNRLTRNYFRARMAWQAVSALLREPPLRHFDWSQHEIRAAAEKLGVGEFVSKLMTYTDPAAFSSQLDLIYHLFAILLESKDRDDLTLEGLLSLPSAPAPTLMNRQSRSSPVPSSRVPYKPSAAIPASTKHLIVEGQPAHFYLYALYGSLKHSQLLIFPDPIWHSFEEPLAYIQRSITPTLKTLTFVTLDPLVYGASRRAFNLLIRSVGVRCFGILHRPPQNPDQLNALREAAPHMAGIMVLSELLVESFQQEFQLHNVSYLPHHAPFADYATSNPASIRSKIGASETQVVFSILGESRKGKGVDLLLEALDYIPFDEMQRMFFLIAGRSQHLDRKMISNSFLKKRANHYLDLRSSKNPLIYAVLTDQEFGEYISASDVGLLLYQGEQRGCMSGVAPNYIWGFKPLIGFEASIVGRMIMKDELGIVVSEETPKAVAQALTTAMRLFGRGWKPPLAYNKYRTEIMPEKVLEKLSEVLGDKTDDANISWSREIVEHQASHWPEGIAEYLSRLPLLHSWDGGKTWNTGGFEADQLATLYVFLKEHLPSSPMLLETGAGNSTICLLFLNPNRLVSIAPEAELFERIRSYCAENSISVASLDVHITGSEWILPQMALAMRDKPPCFDFALIDGSHNWPMVFVDFCYANYMLKPGGLIMIDDVNLHSVKELARMLSEQPDFRLELDLRKSLIFRRISDQRTLNEWPTIPYISRKTSEYAQAKNSFSLYPVSNTP